MSIYTKLLQIQKENITVTKDGKNPHFKSKYATLNEVLDKVKKPLNDAGIVIVQEPTAEGLKTRLIDTEDNSEVSSLMPYVGHDTAQKVLACNTYYRRGSLVSLLGLEDEDDDGNTASAPKPAVKTAYEQAKALIQSAKNDEELVALAKKIDASTKLTADEKEDLQNLIHESSN